MSRRPQYRLQIVLDQKEQARKDAEQALAAARAVLEQEEARRNELEAERARLLEHIEETRRRRQERAEGEGLSVEESHRYKLYLQRLFDQRKDVDLRIYQQSRVVERAAEAVETAKGVLITCAREHEAMNKHREQWQRELADEARRKEQKEMEEIGAAQYLKRRREEMRS